MVNFLFLTNRKSHLLSDIDCRYFPGSPTRYDGYPKVSCGCSVTVPSKRGALSYRRQQANRTHVEDVKEPVELLHPSSDGVFIVLRVEQSRSRASFTPLDDLLLDLSHGSATGTSVSANQQTWQPAGLSVIFTLFHLFPRLFVVL